MQEWVSSPFGMWNESGLFKEAGVLRKREKIKNECGLNTKVTNQHKQSTLKGFWSYKDNESGPNYKTNTQLKYIQWDSSTEMLSVFCITLLCPIASWMWM